MTAVTTIVEVIASIQKPGPALRSKNQHNTFSAPVKFARIFYFTSFGITSIFNNFFVAKLTQHHHTYEYIIQTMSLIRY